MSATYVQLQISTPTDGDMSLTKHISVTQRTWVHNGIGTARFFVPNTNPLFARITAPGTIFRLREENIPTWIGIATSQDWVPGGVTLNCKSAEWFLTGSLVGQGRVYGAATPTNVGSVAYDVFMNACVANRPLHILKPGIFSATPMVFRSYSYDDAYDIISKLCEDTGAAFWVDDKLNLNCQDTRGRDLRTSVMLREGKHLSDVELNVSFEDIYTAVISLSSATNVVDKYKVLKMVPSTSFFRAKRIDAGSDATPDMMVDTVQNFLQVNAHPRVAIKATVLPQAGAFPFWVGDRIRLILSNPVYSHIDVHILGTELGTDNRLSMVCVVMDTIRTGDIQPWGIT